jgi:hypothetical protein
MPYAPTWIPFWLIVVNTIIVEGLLAGSIWWFIVRRATKRRRAAFLFSVVAIIVTAAQGLAALEVFGPPSFQHREVHLDRGAVKLAFDWHATVVLGRATDPRWIVIETGRGRPHVLTEPHLTDALWALRERSDDAETVAAFRAALRRSPGFDVLPPDVAALVSAR